MSHTIEITRLADETSDDVEYEISGTCDQSCKVWRGCGRKACQRMNPDYAPFDERHRHGVEHQQIDGEWMVETNECALQFAYDLASNAGDAPACGVYSLHVDWNGDAWLTEVGYLKQHDSGESDRG